MKKVIFVGWVNQGKAPVDGETTKNQYIIAELKKYCKVTVLDFYKKKQHPWIYVQALWTLISKPKATIILSTSAKNVYTMLKVFKKLHIKREIIHWVIGGAFGKHVQEGRFRADVFNYVKYNLVQCQGMIAELESAGVTNAKFVSNFKPITYYPDLEKVIADRKSSDKIRFVFLSRIMPDKGCNYLLEAIRVLNEKGLQDKFIVDFYGKIDSSYKNYFMLKVNQLTNTAYHGLLDLRTKEGYDTLATYHAMVFPTIHPTEGFSGIFIDAFISGLPILASKWAYNEEFITQGDLGIIYPAHDINALADSMEDCILGKTDLFTLAIKSRNEAENYQSDKVITKDFIKNIGLTEK
jgi:glycosyltransferase involved in cell wall biosynthesis